MSFLTNFKKLFLSDFYYHHYNYSYLLFFFSRYLDQVGLYLNIIFLNLKYTNSLYHY